MAETFDKNMIDKDEYPQTAELENALRAHAGRTVARARRGANTAIGTSTIGSSEACMLGGLALKWRWREKVAQGWEDRPDRPNLVMGTNTQVCWHKFCRYWDVETALVCRWRRAATSPIPSGPPPPVDENTIGVVACWAPPSPATTNPSPGSARRWTNWPPAGGLDVPIHVDGASGRFVAPFLQPELGGTSGCRG